MMKWLREFWKSSPNSDKAHLAGADTKSASPRVRRERAPRARVQVGIDFGTSTTKVLYRILGQRDDVVRAPNFPETSSDGPGYFVPSLLAFSGDGSLKIGSIAQEFLADQPWGAGLTRFKMLVAGLADSSFLDAAAWDRYRENVSSSLGDETRLSPEVGASLFLADVMRRTRSQLRTDVAADELDIVFNTCVPIDQTEHATVHQAFERVIACAQWLYDTLPEAETPSRHWVDVANEHFGDLKYRADDALTRIFVVPEAVASFATYQTSLKHREGIHALVDIGAGTTDVSIAYLAIPKRDVPSAQWWSARSVPHGMGRIEDSIASSMKKVPGGTMPTRLDLQAAIAASGTNRSLAASVVATQMRELWLQTEAAWREAYGHYPGQARWSKDQVQVFLAGGGAQLGRAKSVFAESWMSNWGPYPTSILPAPDGALAIGGVPFSRLSVAFGLCRTLPELGDIVLPSNAQFHGLAHRHSAIFDDDFDGPT